MMLPTFRVGLCSQFSLSEGLLQTLPEVSFHDDCRSSETTVVIHQCDCYISVIAYLSEDMSYVLHVSYSM